MSLALLPLEDHPSIPASVPRVIVAEDHSASRELLNVFLRDLGVDIRLACNGAEALQLVTADPPDLVLMDCDMPYIDGFEATHEIRAFERDHSLKRTTIIGLTACCLPTHLRRCCEVGMDSYLTKPILLPVLAGMLAKFLRLPVLLLCLSQELCTASCL